MSDYSNRRVLVYDSGLNVGLANALARDFGEVLYFTNWQRSLPTMTEAAIGHGYEGVTRIKKFWNVIDKVDLFVFPDCYNDDIQIHLESIGKRVWGSRSGADLELNRWQTRKYLESAGLPTSPGNQIVGLDKLRDYLKEHENCFVKISCWRGDMESWRAINYLLSESRLDELALRLGPLQHMTKFVVEDAIETEIEVGYDGIFTGEWPNVAMQGYEKKDAGLLASVMPYDELPDEVREVNDRLESKLKESKYRNFFSTEIRVGEDSLPYMIDATCRAPIPSSAIQIANYKNLSEIIWHGAAGESVPVETRAKFGAEAMIYSDWAHKHPITVSIKEDIQQFVSLFNSVNVGKETEVVMPSNQDVAVIGDEVGSVIGLGDTLEEAIKECQDHADGIEGMGIYIKVESLKDLLPQIAEAQAKGIKFSDEPIPESV